MSPATPRAGQRGMALVVGLILLALMTIMAITGFNIGRTSLDIVGNMQTRQEVIAAANSAIQEALSTTRMFQSPTAVYLNPCKGANTRCYDVNGDDVSDITVTLSTPKCIQSQVIPNAALDLSSLTSPQAGCATGVSQTFGTEGAQSGGSLCANSVWELVATATDDITEAQVVVTEGAAVQVSTDDIGISCP